MPSVSCIIDVISSIGYTNLRYFLLVRNGVMCALWSLSIIGMSLTLLIKIARTKNIRSTQTLQSNKIVGIRTAISILCVCISATVNVVYAFLVTFSFTQTPYYWRYLLVGNNVFFSLSNTLIYTITTSLFSKLFKTKGQWKLKSILMILFLKWKWFALKLVTINNISLTKITDYIFSN